MQTIRVCHRLSFHQTSHFICRSMAKFGVVFTSCDCHIGWNSFRFFHQLHEYICRVGEGVAEILHQVMFFEFHSTAIAINWN